MDEVSSSRAIAPVDRGLKGPGPARSTERGFRAHVDATARNFGKKLRNALTSVGAAGAMVLAPACSADTSAFGGRPTGAGGANTVDGGSGGSNGTGGAAVDGGIDGEGGLDAGIVPDAGPKDAGEIPDAEGNDGGQFCEESITFNLVPGSVVDKDIKHGQKNIENGCFKITNNSCLVTFNYGGGRFSQNAPTEAFSPVRLVREGQVLAEDFIIDKNTEGYDLTFVPDQISPQTNSVPYCIVSDATWVPENGEAFQISIRKPVDVVTDAPLVKGLRLDFAWLFFK